MDWKRLLVAAVALSLVGSAVTHLRSDQRRVHRQLSALTDTLAKGGPEETLQAASAARRVSAFFTPGFSISARPYQGRIRDPQELATAVLRFRSAADTITVVARERDLDLRPNDTATLHFLATVTLSGAERSSRESYRVRSRWQKDDGRWRINELEVLEVLEGSRMGVFPW